MKILFAAPEQAWGGFLNKIRESFRNIILRLRAALAWIP